ncbi:MAG: extracellular solute-binding protein [Chloroflexi bacterium]|nr:extracellular solute-binding protein [Chloroflexota bacterium]
MSTSTHGLHIRVFSLLMMLFLLNACGGSLVSNSTQEVTPITSNLVIYSGRTESFMVPIIVAFNDVYPDISIQLKSGKNSELAAAIIEERANPQADIFISTDMLTHINLSNYDVLAPAPIRGSDSIPDEFKPVNGTWTSVTARARVIMYNTDLVSAADAPRSMFDLTDPKWRGKVIFANSSNGPFQAQVAAMMTLVGRERTAEWLRDLVRNDTTFFGGASDLRKAVGAGEFAIGVLNHYNFELQKREATDNRVAAIYPDQAEGEMGVLVNTTTIGQIRGGPNPTAARLFAEFIISETAQQIYADTNYEYPILPTISVASGILPPNQFRRADVNMQAVADDVAAAIELMQEAGIP